MNACGFNPWNVLQNKLCSNNPCAENSPKGNIRNVFSVSFSIHWLCGPCRTLASFKINFQSSLSLVIFFPASNSHFLRIIFNHLFLDFSADLLPSGIFLNTFFTFPSSGILSACPNHQNLWLVQIVHTMFSVTGSNISLSIFLSHISEVFPSLSLSVQNRESYITTDLRITVR